MDVFNKFLQQNIKDPELKNACGAFCIKYWQWHSGMEDFRTVNQRESILHIYNRIQFGCYGKKLNISQEYSNPLMICVECNGDYFYDAVCACDVGV